MRLVSIRRFISNYAVLTTVAGIFLSHCKAIKPESQISGTQAHYVDKNIDEMSIAELWTEKLEILAENAPGDVDAIPPATTALTLAGQDEYAAFISDRKVMEALEKLGYGFGGVVAGNTQPNASNGALASSIGYNTFATTIEGDLRDLQIDDPQLKAGMSNSHRLLDKAWLRSKNARFELSGIVNRMDLQSLFKVPGLCGALILTYRLSYETAIPHVEGKIYSRVPFTAMAVYGYATDETLRAAAAGAPVDCGPLARAWKIPDSRTPEAIVSWLTAPEGPASKKYLDPKKLLSLAINAQVVRWPSSVKPDMGGNARYLFRQFQPTPNNPYQFVPGGLPGTIDVDRILKSKDLKDELRAELLKPETISEVDLGNYRVPAKFLAMRAIASSPYGLDRPVNRLYDQIFDPTEFDVAVKSQLNSKFVKSGRAFLSRLNDASCVGCHQGRSVAGFHFLGQDGPQTHILNSVAVEYSEHFGADQERRLNYISAVAQNVPADPGRNFSYGPGSGGAKSGSYCALPSMTDPSFTAWKCAAGLTCTEVVGGAALHFGRCENADKYSGTSCFTGTVKGSFNRPTSDSLTAVEEKCGTDRSCFTISRGFPGGMCNSSCRHVKKDKGEVCAVVGGSGFNTCIAEKKLGYQACLDNFTEFSGRAACDHSTPCREDFICAHTKGETVGACVPTYFLFQIRLDGHPEGSAW